jgi:hypothetical protein
MIAELAYELLPYAVLLYAADGLVRVREGEAALCAAWRARFRWRGPGWHLAGLLPTAEVFVVGRPSLAGVGQAAERDLASIRALRAVQGRYGTVLSIAGTALFLATFVALPMAVYRYHDVPRAAEATVAVAALLWTGIMAMAARALRQAGATRSAAASALSPALFFPPAAAHIRTFLWRDAFRSFPPLAVAAVLLPGERFRRLARHELRRIDEAERRGAGVPTPAGSSSRGELLALLSALGIDAHQVAAEDPPRDAQAAVFCPLCETEYRSGYLACTDCDVPLRTYSTRPGTG